MTWRELLLRAYPRSWRDEYGEEFAGLLAQRRLTFAVVADVLSGAARQHLNRDAPWKICGAGLFLWTCIGLLLGGLTHSRAAVLWFGSAGLLLLFGAGAWTGLKTRSGIWGATRASAKAAVFGEIGVVLLYLDVVRQMGATLVQGHTIYFWCGKTLAVNMAFSLVFGLAGALASRLRRPRTT
jgi:hypothetical protein